MRTTLALAAGSLLLLTGCGGTAEVSTDDLEQEVTNQLERQFESPIKSMDCPDALPAEVDAEVRCVLTAPDDSRVGLTVTTTEVDGDNVRFDVKVDDELMDQ